MSKYELCRDCVYGEVFGFLGVELDNKTPTVNWERTVMYCNAIGAFRYVNRYECPMYKPIRELSIEEKDILNMDIDDLDTPCRKIISNET